jgi:hypothetical protein
VLTVVLLAQGNLNKGSLLFLVGIAVGAIPCLIVLGQAAMADLAAQSDSSANNEQEDDVRRPCDRATETIDVSQTIVYRPRKGKLLLLLAVSATFVPAGLSMAHSGEAAGWFVAAFFGLAGVVFSLQFVPNCSYLRVSAKGIELRAFWRTHGYEWSDISHFYAGSIASKQFVMFQFSSSYRRAGTARTVTKTLTGAEGVLPDTYGFEAEELAEHLNQWKARLDHDNNKRDA